MKELFKRLSLILIAVSLSIQTYGQHRLSAGVRGGYPFSPQKELLNGINSLGRPLDVAAAVDVQYAYILPKTSYQGIGLSLLSLFDWVWMQYAEMTKWHTQVASPSLPEPMMRAKILMDVATLITPILPCKVL